MPPTLLSLPPELLLQILAHIPFHSHPSASSHTPILLTHPTLTTPITTQTSTLTSLITRTQLPLSALALSVTLTTVAQLAWIREVADTIDETPNLTLVSQCGSLMEGRVETTLSRGPMHILIAYAIDYGVAVEFIERGEVLGRAQCRSTPYDR